MVQFVNPSEYEQYGPLAEDRLHRLETALGQRLPDDYRAFLIEHNGGQPEPSLFTISEEEGSDVVQEFLGLHDGPRFLQLDNTWADHREWMPETLLPIALDPGGNMVCLGVSGEERGAVYFWDHELAPGEGGIETFENSTPIAASFAAFVDGLYSDVVQ